jgi:hypothetical protein
MLLSILYACGHKSAMICIDCASTLHILHENNELLCFFGLYYVCWESEHAAPFERVRINNHLQSILFYQMTNVYAFRLKHTIVAVTVNSAGG